MNKAHKKKALLRQVEDASLFHRDVSDARPRTVWFRSTNIGVNDRSVFLL